MKLLIKIAFRHLWAKHNYSFITFSTILSILGLTLGISSLIIISSISDAFNEKVTSKLSKIDGHLRIKSYYSNIIDLNNKSELNTILNENSNYIKYRADFIEKHAIVQKDGISQGIIVYGIEQDALLNIFNLNKFTTIKSSFNDNSIIIGRNLANKLNININDKIIFIDPIQLAKNKIFKAKKLKVVNIFETNFPEYDNILTFMPLTSAQFFFNLGSNISGIIVNIDDHNNIDVIDKILYESIKDKNYLTSTWKERHSSLIEWLNIYDVPIKIIMLFIISVAIFNIGASLWMIIIEKSREYGILNALGFNKKQLAVIILFQALIISLIASIISVTISFIIIIMQQKFHFIKIPNDIYFMDYLPVKISIENFIIYPLGALILIMFLSYIPARKILNLDSSKLLRYE